MRGRIYKRRESSRHGRRLLLAGLLVASGQFAQAETPLAMVPLPLTPLEGESAGVRINPFCQPVVVEAANTKASFSPERVRVAGRQAFAGSGRVETNNWRPGGASSSGDVMQVSGAEVKPPGQSADSGKGLRSFLQNPVIEASGGVRSNPLATHFTADMPHEPKVDLDGLRALKASAKTESGFSFSFSDSDADVDPTAERGASEPVELSFNDDSAVSVDQGLAMRPENGSASATPRPATRPAAPWRASERERAANGLPEPINLRAFEPLKLANGRVLQALPPEPVRLPEPANLQDAADLANDGDLRDDAAGLPDLAYEPAAVLVVSPQESRLVNGGRPRVEVGRPTVAVDRLASTSIVPGRPRLLLVESEVPVVSEAVQASHELDSVSESAVVEAVTKFPVETMPAKSQGLQSIVVPSEQPMSGRVSGGDVPAGDVPAGDMPAGDVSGPESKVVVMTPETALPLAKEEPINVKAVDETFVASFNLKPTEVRAIKFDLPIKHVQSDDMSVCAVIKAATGQIQLIATGTGTTGLSVHTLGEDGIDKVDRYEVTVGEVRTATVDSPEAIAMTLTQTVQSAFPGSNILVSAEAGRLIVTGSCPDEESARRMLRMLRSACSAPVIDRVKVR